MADKGMRRLENTDSTEKTETRAQFSTWSAAEIKRAPVTGKTQTYTVGDGLLVVITKGGKKTWTARLTKDGRDTRRAIGDATSMPVREAKRLALAAQEAFRGSDKKTLRGVIEEWQDTRDVGADELARCYRYLGYLPDTLCDKAIEMLTRKELVECVVDMCKTHSPGIGRGIASVIERALFYAMDSGYINASPAQGLTRAQRLPKLPPKVHIYTTLDEAEMGLLLRRLDAFEMEQSRRALQLLIYLVPRVSELLAAEWTEINFDTATWTKPAEHTKRRRVHAVPLPRQAVELLVQQRQYAGDTRFVFPSRTRPSESHMVRTRLNQILATLGIYKQTLHGFRSFAKTKLLEMGYSDALTELMLAHEVERDATRAAYNRAEFWEPRRAMMQVYADYLDGLKENAKR